jgi:ubiquinone biosynthesis protein
MMSGGIGDDTGEGDMKGPLRKMLSDKYDHYKRVAEILGAISMYGFGRMGDAASSLKKLHVETEEDKKVAALKAPVRFRLLLERLGPTFIKLGQMLSTRSDLISEEFAAELGLLRDSAPPVPIEQVRQIIASELGAPPEEVFATFDPEPIASASIGQVHRATEKGTGEALAVKIQRPGVLEVIKADIVVLHDLVGTLKRLFRSIESFDLEGAVDEFGRMIMREIDYTVEGRNIERFRTNMASVEGVVLPKVHWALSTRRVLTMDFMDGTSLDDAEAIKKVGVDPKKLTGIIGKAYIKQIFVDGFFHADPHQGNLFVMPDGKVGFIDFGAIGYLDDTTRDLVTDLYLAIIKGDAHRAAIALVDVTVAPERALDMATLEWGLRDFIDYNVLKRDRVKMDKGMNQSLVAVSLRNGLHPPASFVLLERALLEVEGVCRALDPAFDVIEFARASMGTLLRERYAPDLDPMQALNTARGYRRLVRELPRRLDKVLKKVEEDDITIKLDRTYFEELRRSIRRSTLVVTVSLVAIAIIYYITYAGPTFHLKAVHITLTVPVIIILWALAMWRIWKKG